MWNNFFKHIDISAENVHILDGNAPDLQAECDAFEEKIKAAGGIELFVGGETLKEAVPFPTSYRLCCRESSLPAQFSGFAVRHPLLHHPGHMSVLAALFSSVLLPQFYIF